MFAGAFSLADKRPGFTMYFDHVVGTKPLQLDATIYQNKWQQNFKITKFKYYLSNFTFITASGKARRTNDCYLINEEDSLSKKINFNLPKSDYQIIEFDFGIDSLHNSNGIQEGALDPINGMYWAWNSGYIFLKLEGSSPASTATANYFEYHLGGYKHPYKCSRRIRLQLSGTNNCHVVVNVLSLLNSDLLGGFHLLPSVSDPKNATPLADDCAKMFQAQ